MTATLMAVQDVILDQSSPVSVASAGTWFSIDDTNAAALLAQKCAATSAAQASSVSTNYPLDTSQAPA